MVGSCIEYLRKNNLGRANFILLDKLAHRDLSPIHTPENVPRLFDLIKPEDERFAPALRHHADTLVARDLDQANRIAYGARRWRVVTLDGQLIDVSGTMSGGGARVARGAMSFKPVSEMMSDQVQKLGNAQKRAQDLVGELAATSAYDSQIKALEKQITSMNEELEKLHLKTATVEGETQALRNKIMEVGGIQLRTQKARVDGLKERMDMLHDDLSNAEVAKTKSEKLKVKNEKARADAEKELETLSKDLEWLEDEVEKHKTGAAELRARTEQSQDEQATMKKELGTLKKDLDAQTSDLNATRALESRWRTSSKRIRKF
nr:Structural maintenance of chromosomes protein 4 [Exophiala xenobiotica]